MSNPTIETKELPLPPDRSGIEIAHFSTSRHDIDQNQATQDVDASVKGELGMTLITTASDESTMYACHVKE